MQHPGLSFLTSTSAKHTKSHTEEFINTNSHSPSKTISRPKYPIFSDLLEDPQDFSSLISWETLVHIFYELTSSFPY